MAVKKKKWGGTRPGAGRPSTGRATKVLSFRVYTENYDLIKAKVDAIVKKLNR